MNLKRENVIWTAGFLEGEGSLYGHKNKYGYIYPVFSAGSSDIDILEKLKNLFGGSIYGPFMKGRLGTKPVYEWMLTHSKLSYALAVAIYPFMGERRKQKIAEIIKQFFLLKTKRRMHRTHREKSSVVQA